MKKILLRSIAVLVLGLGLSLAILPQKVVVERKAEVGADAQAFFLYLADLNQFSHWSPFQEMDPQQRTEIKGSGVGAQFTWKS